MQNVYDKKDLIMTTQMVRDALTFAGPSSITELLRYMKVAEEYRTKIHVLLAKLQDQGAAEYSVEKGVWISKIVLF